MLLEQVSGLDRAIESCCVLNLEGTVVDKHAVFDDSCWREFLEFPIRTQQAGSRFIESQWNVADEYRSLDGCRCISLQAEPHRVHCRQRLARDTVSAEGNCRFGCVSKPTLLNPALIDISLDSFQLLPPVGGGIGQIFVDIGRSAPEFVRIRDVRGWERSQRGDNVEKK